MGQPLSPGIRTVAAAGAVATFGRLVEILTNITLDVLEARARRRSFVRR